jgi:hypothetical protein
MTDRPAQLELPFLTANQAATIDAARVAVDRAATNAIAARRPVEADELIRLGAQLTDMLNANAAAHRASTR